jgi:hypothetical protein
LLAKPVGAITAPLTHSTDPKLAWAAHAELQIKYLPVASLVSAVVRPSWRA